MKLSKTGTAKLVGGLFMGAGLISFATAYLTAETVLAGVGAIFMGLGATALTKAGLGASQ